VTRDVDHDCRVRQAYVEKLILLFVAQPLHEELM